jgi:helix-turn-helix protein
MVVRGQDPTGAGRVGGVVIVDGEEYLGVDEAAHLLGVKPATLYAYVSRGILKS